jgi:hypothetical protein
LGYNAFNGKDYYVKIGVETHFKTPEQIQKNGLLQRKLMNGDTVSSTLAHEILETIGNPYVNRETYTTSLPVYTMVLPLTSEVIDTNTLMSIFPSIFTVLLADGTVKKATELKSTDVLNKVYITAYVHAEVVNPVQSNRVDVMVNNRNIEICDFITPEWFQQDSTGPFNYKKTLPRPFELDVGGYVDFFLTNLNLAVKTALPKTRLFIQRVE